METAKAPIRLLNSTGLSLVLLMAGAASPSIAVAQVAPSPVAGQDTAAPSITPDILPPTASDNAKSGEIVVTGSRLKRSNFDTPSPVEVYTQDEAVLSGAGSVADVLQGATVTSGTSQINSSFLGYVSQNGPASNTVGLRGLGAQRTLVLLDGRRLAPSGVGPELVAPDLNVLPDAVIDQIQVLREGASSVYGSDAIAGVINIITKKNFNGITLDLQDNQPLDTGGAGNQLRGSIVAGKVWDRGHITASFEYHQEKGLQLSDRSAFNCPRDLLFNPTTGAEVGAIDPATGGLSCFPYALGSGTGIAGGYGIAYSFNTGAENRIAYANGNINNLSVVNGLERASPSPYQTNETVISPLRTYTGYLDGSYELDALGDAEIYGQALFTRRDSSQEANRQLSITTNDLPGAQIYGGSYGGTPLSAYGYPTSPFFPNSLANAGYNYFTPFAVLQTPYESSQRVDFLRANGGLRGNVTLGDWTYNANFQYSKTWSQNTINQILTDRFDNALQAVAAPPGTPAGLITYATAGEYGAGNPYTCASNVDANGNFITGSSCVPLNLYDPSLVTNGHIPSAVANYLFENDVDHTYYEEITGTIDFNGSLFTLPGGKVQAAVGYEHRHEMLDDVPSAYAQAGDLYNYSSGGETKGTDAIDEVYGEVDLPFLKDRPFFNLVDIDLSGRYTHYRSYGSDFTYHINANYAPTSWLRFRGNYGTSFRAPNLFELYVAKQTGFDASGADPCSGYATTYAPGSQIYQNCAAALTPILGATGASNFLATAGPEVTSEGGAGVLKAEKARTYGFGLVLTAPESLHVGTATLSIDYFNIQIRGEIAQLGTTILSDCYEASTFPNNPYCALIAPRYAAGTPQQGNLVSYLNPYINVAFQESSGVDLDFDYRHPLGGGLFNLRVKATRNIHQYYQDFAGDPVVDYNGTLGTQGSPGGPKVVGDLSANYLFLDGKLQLHYGLTYVGREDSSALLGPYYAGLGLGLVNTIFFTHPYFLHELSAQLIIDKSNKFTLGVTNLTNANPPVISQTPLSNANTITRIGNFFNSSNYDYYGRSIFIHVTHSFM